MEIKITGAGSSGYWYADKIGEVFEVRGRFNEDFYVRYRNRDDEYIVSKEDCEIIGENGQDEDEPSSDAVSRPSHYTQGGIEVIDIIAQTVAGYKDPFVGHCVATTTKYLNRAPFKNNLLEDLKKGRAYLDFAINHMEKDKD